MECHRSSFKYTKYTWKLLVDCTDGPWPMYSCYNWASQTLKYQLRKWRTSGHLFWATRLDPDAEATSWSVRHVSNALRTRASGEKSESGTASHLCTISQDTSRLGGKSRKKRGAPQNQMIPWLGYLTIPPSCWRVKAHKPHHPLCIQGAIAIAGHDAKTLWVWCSHSWWAPQ